MADYSRFRYCKFFRGLIASRQPHEIIDIVNRYERDLKNTEGSYMDIIIKSDGILTYKEVMEMPIPSLMLFVERLNKITEERNQSMKQKSR